MPLSPCVCVSVCACGAAAPPKSRPFIQGDGSQSVQLPVCRGTLIEWMPPIIPLTLSSCSDRWLRGESGEGKLGVEHGSTAAQKSPPPPPSVPFIPFWGGKNCRPSPPPLQMPSEIHRWSRRRPRVSECDVTQMHSHCNGVATLARTCYWSTQKTKSRLTGEASARMEAENESALLQSESCGILQLFTSAREFKMRRVFVLVNMTISCFPPGQN